MTAAAARRYRIPISQDPSLHSPACRFNLPVPPDYPLPYRTHRPITSPLPHSHALPTASLAATTSQRTPRPFPSHVLIPNPSTPSHRYHGAESPTEGAPGPGSKWGGGGVAMWSGHGDNTLDRDQSSRLSGTHFEPSVDVAEVDEESRLVFDACSCRAVRV